jgi:hypothetical protein
MSDWRARAETLRVILGREWSIIVHLEQGRDAGLDLAYCGEACVLTYDLVTRIGEVCGTRKIWIKFEAGECYQDDPESDLSASLRVEVRG